MADPQELKELIGRLAEGLGFVAFGVAPAGASEHAQRFRRFLQQGCHAGMSYLARDPERRCDVRSVLPGAASVICLAASYGPRPEDRKPGAGGQTIARYARGRDYHRLLARRCRKLVAALAAAEPSARAKVCVDSCAVLERGLAASAGVGWIGRNGCLIRRRVGSYLLLAEIVTNVPLPPDRPAANHCGRCRACLAACPTAAIRPDGLVDSRRCISYLTIEHRGSIPPEFRRKMGARIFGCDACQEACPHNATAPPGDAELVGPSPAGTATAGAVLNWTAADWDRLTRGSATRRAKYEIFLRNAALAAGNSRDPSLRAPLQRLAAHASEIVAESARWALARLGPAGDQGVLGRSAGPGARTQFLHELRGSE